MIVPAQDTTNQCRQCLDGAQVFQDKAAILKVATLYGKVVNGLFLFICILHEFFPKNSVYDLNLGVYVYVNYR